MRKEVFRHEDPARSQLNLSKVLHSFHDDFWWLANDVATRPTRIAKIIPNIAQAPIGACAAAGTGMGVIHFVPTPDGSITPLLWRQIQCQLVSFSNPDGTINNSGLELAGLVAHNNVLAMAAKVEERTIHNVYNSMAAVFWQPKGAFTTTGPLAYLLHLQALHQHQFHYVPKDDYIPGQYNVMADFLLRAWHLTDDQIIAHFNSTFLQGRPVV